MKNIPFLLCILLLSQCKQKSYESKLNDGSFTEGKVINYYYDGSGKLLKESSMSFLMVGNKPDSLSFVTTYFYDANGRKIKVEENDGSNKLLSTTLFDYDLRDSLLAEYTIDIYGDTTQLVENIYGENGSLHLQKHRLLLNSQSGEDILSGKRNYDTLFTLTENFYQAGLLTKSIDRNIKNALVTEREFEYDGQILTKMRVYEFPGSKKQLLITNIYLDDNASKLEKVTVNILGDTVGVKQVEKNSNGEMSKISEVDTEMGNIFITNFNDKGQVATELEIIKVLEKKTIRFFSYDLSGRKVKVVSRDEPLTEKEKNVL